ncbi:MAG: hypothetical protein QXG44_13785 [Candidatus Jordarchaeaceae archaeon]
MKNLKFLLGPDTPSIQTVRNRIIQAAQKNNPLIQELLKGAKMEKHLQVDETDLPLDGNVIKLRQKRNQPKKVSFLLK